MALFHHKIMEDFFSTGLEHVKVLGDINNKGIRSRKRALYMWQEFRLTHKTERNAPKK